MSDSKAKAMLEALRKKKSAIAAATGRREKTQKPAQGKHTYRILPPWRGGDDTNFYHDFGQHFIKNEKGELKAVYICSADTFGRDCPVCNGLDKAKDLATSDEMIEVLKEGKSKQVFLVNALHRTASDDEGKKTPIILSLGSNVFNQILEIYETFLAEEGIELTDLKDGIDLQITREGKGLNTKYSVMAKPKSTPVPASVMEQIHDLDEYVKQEYEEGERKALSAIGTVSGAAISSGSSSAARLSGPKSKPMAEETEPLDEGDSDIGSGVIDAEVEDDDTVADEDMPLSAAEADDIDALLAGIE